MALQTFTAGQILTAAQMTTLQTNDYNQTVSTKTASYVLVAADKGTRVVMNSASATTITVNTSLFAAGDTLYLQNINTGVCTVTAGTATVTSAGPLAIPQWGSGTLYFTSASAAIYFPSAVTAAQSGLTLVKSQTIGTAVSSVTVTSAFSSTYDNYLITLNGGSASATGDISWKLDAASNYYYARMYLNYNSGTFNGDAAQNSTQFSAGFFGGANGLTGQITVFSPNLAKRTSYTGNYGGNVAGYPFAVFGGFQNADTQHTDFTIAPASGTLTGGTIRVYGYQNS